MFSSVIFRVYALSAALTILRCSSFFSLSNSGHRIRKYQHLPARRDVVNLTPLRAQSSTGIPSTAGADSLGFSSTLTNNGFFLPTQVIFGSNSIEHGVNLLEEKTNSVILVSGWNSARLDPILWELEPRGFRLGICCVTEEASYENVYEVLAAIMQSDCGAVIAMGCGSVIEAAKLATMLINAHTDRHHLAELSASELGDLILSMSAGEYLEPVGGILLVSIPSLPSLGAELSAITAVRRDIKSSSKSGVSSNSINRSVQSGTSSHGEEQQIRREVSKMYLRSAAPDLCLVQPSLTYRAPMALVHDRLLALIATSVDIILSDPGFLPELLAWDALRQLILLLDKAIEAAQDRFTKWTFDPDFFEKQTVHDDEKDHRSQQFRRYGHGFSLQGIEDLCRIGISIATARSGMPIGGIQYISDSIGQATEQKKGHTNRVGHLLPSYLVTLLNWCESDDDIALKTASRRGQSSSEDPMKSYIRTKLNKISEVFQTSKFISDSTPVKQSQPLGDVIAGMGVIVGETSGQIIASTASTANPAPQITLAGSLEEQMNNLKNHFRLLAGPLGSDEEEDISGIAEGDSLSCLINQINKKKDSGEGDSELNINPEEYEKEFKMNFNITDDISKKEVGFDGNEIIKTIKKRSSRTIPTVKLSPMECTYILEDMRRVCGKSPAALLSVKAIEGIFSGPCSRSFDDHTDDDNDDGIIYQLTEQTQQQQQQQQQQENQQELDGVVNGRISETVTRVTESYDSNGEDQNDYDRDNDSDINNRSDSDGDLGHQLEIGVKWDLPQSDHADEILMESDPEFTPTSMYSRFVENFISVRDALKDSSSGIIEAEKSVEKSSVKDDLITFVPPQDSIEETSVSSSESNSNTTAGSERSIPKTVTVDTLKAKSTDDAAAAHRRKVKNILSMLSSQSDNSKEDSEVGKPKQEKPEVKKKSSKNSLTEEQADTLARLLEQRIHDRWAEAAKTQNTIPRPFR